MRSIVSAVSARMNSAGGCYNFGNVLDLYSVAASAIVARHPTKVAEAFIAIQDKLMGDSSSMFLSLAAIVFFISGEAYYQAWKNNYPPNTRLNLAGDLLSGSGAVALGLGLYGFGQPLLAAASGGLHALSKFGSALNASKKAGKLLNREFKMANYVTTAADVIKDLALVSRVPALMICTLSITSNIVRLPWHAAVENSIMPIILGWCYLKFGQGDWRLTFDKSLIRQAVSSISDILGKAISLPSLPVHAFEALEGTQLSEFEISQPELVKQARKYNTKKSLAKMAVLGIVMGIPFLPKLSKEVIPIALPVLAQLTWLLARSAASANNNDNRLQMARRQLQRPASEEVHP